MGRIQFSSQDIKISLLLQTPRGLGSFVPPPVAEDEERNESHGSHSLVVLPTPGRGKFPDSLISVLPAASLSAGTQPRELQEEQQHPFLRTLRQHFKIPLFCLKAPSRSRREIPNPCFASLTRGMLSWSGTWTNTAGTGLDSKSFSSPFSTSRRKILTGCHSSTLGSFCFLPDERKTQQREEGDFVAWSVPGENIPGSKQSLSLSGP